MKNAIWIFIFLLVAACQPKTGPTAGESQIPYNAVLQDYEDFPGLQKATVYAGNIVIGEGDFLNGLHHGVWVTFDQTGQVTSVRSYINGKLQGIELRFDAQGYLKRKSYYANEVLEGEYLEFNRKNIVDRKNYSNGVLHGLQMKYYRTGTVMEESTYVNGVIDGEAKWYDANGNLSFKYVYDMGELVEQSGAE